MLKSTLEAMLIPGGSMCLDLAPCDRQRAKVNRLRFGRLRFLTVCHKASVAGGARYQPINDAAVRLLRTIEDRLLDLGWR